MSVVTDIVEGIGDIVGGALNAVGNVVVGIGRIADSVLNEASKFVLNALEHPVETIITIGAASVGIPPYVTSAALTAVKGGNLEDIAKSAAISYAGSSFMTNTQVGMDISNYTSNAFSGDFTDSMMENFNLTPDQAVQIAKASSATLNSSVMGGITAALRGKSVIDGMASGFTSGLVYSSTNSFFDSINKDQNWGLSPTALNLVKGASRTVLNTVISGKGDPAQAIGNYIASATIDLGASAFANAAKSTYNDLTGKTAAAQKAQDAVLSATAAYDAKAADFNALKSQIDSNATAYSAIIANEYTPFKTQLDSIVADNTAAQQELANQVTVYNDNKAKYDSYDKTYYNQAIQTGGGGEYGDTYDFRILDANGNPPPVTKDSYRVAANDAAAAAQIAADKSKLTADDANKLAEDSQPILDKLTALKSTIDTQTAAANVIKTDITVPSGDNTAAKLKAASETYNTTYSEYATSQAAANKAAENYTKQIAEVATRNAAIDSLNSGAIFVTGNLPDGYSLSNGMVLGKDGKFSQDGQPVFANAAGVDQTALDFTDTAGNKVDFSRDAGRVMSTTDVQNALKRDYNVIASDAEAKKFTGTLLNATDSAAMDAFAKSKIGTIGQYVSDGVVHVVLNGYDGPPDQYGYSIPAGTIFSNGAKYIGNGTFIDQSGQKAIIGSSALANPRAGDPSTSSWSIMGEGVKATGSVNTEISSLLAIGNSANPPEKGGTSLVGTGSGSQSGPDIGIPTWIAKDDATGTSLSITSNGFALLTYSDGHSVAINTKTQEPIWVNLADTQNALAKSPDKNTQKLSETVNEVVANKIAEDKVIADKVIADKEIADKAIVDKAAIDKAITDKAAADKVIADKAAADKVIADKVIADKVISDKAIADAAAVVEAARVEAEKQKAIADAAIEAKRVADAAIAKATEDREAARLAKQVEDMAAAETAWSKATAESKKQTDIATSAMTSATTALTNAQTATTKLDQLVVDGKISDAIANIKFPDGITIDQVKESISSAIKDNPGLSATDVANSIKTYMDANPGLNAADVNTAIAAASNSQTLALQTAKETLSKSIADLASGTTTSLDGVKASILALQAAGLTTAQVNALVAAGTSNVTTELKTVISDASTAQTTALDAAKTLLSKSISDLASKITTDTAALAKSIDDLKAAGLTQDQVKTLIADGTASVSGATKTAIDNAVKGLVTSQDLADAKSGLEKSISDLSTGATSNFNSLTQSIADLRAAGLTEAQVKAAVDAGSAGVSAELKGAIQTTAATQATSLDNAKTALTKSITDLADKTTTDMTAVNKAISDLQAAGLTTDQVKTLVNAGTTSVEGTLKTAISDAATVQTEALDKAKTDLSSAISALSSKTTDDVSSINTAIAALQAAGLTAAQVEGLVSKGTTSVEGTLKTAISEAATAQTTALDTAKVALSTAISDLSSKTTTDFAGVNKAIADLSAAGLTTAQVQKIVDTSSVGVSADLKSAIVDAGAAQTTALATAKNDLSRSISDLSTKTTNDMTAVTKAISDLQAAGLTTDQVQKLVGTGTAGVEATLKTAIADAATTQTSALDKAKTDLAKSITDLSNKTTTDLAAVNKSIASLKAAGLTTKQVASLIATGSANVTTDLKQAITDANTAQATALDVAKTGLTKAIGDLSSKTTTDIAGVNQAIADLRAAGLTEAQVKAIVSEQTVGVSTDVRSAITDASTSMATALDKSKADLSKSIADLASGTATGFEALNKSIVDLQAAGLTQAQVKALVDAGSTNVSTDLKAAIATASTAQADALVTAKADLSKSISDLSSKTTTDMAGVNQAIADLKAAGLTTEQVNALITTGTSNVTTDLKTAISDANIAQATALDTAKAGLSKAISDLSSKTTTDISGVNKAIADLRAAGLTEDQVKAIVETQTKGVSVDVKAAISDAASGMATALEKAKTDLSTSISSLASGTQTNFDTLNKSIADLKAAGLTEAQVKSLVNAGTAGVTTELKASIAQAAATTTQQIAGVSADFQAKLAASDQATQDRFSQLSDAQKAQAAQLATTSGNLQDAITQAAATTTQQIAGVSADFQAKLAASDAVTQANFNKLTDAQKAQAEQLTTSTGNLQSSIAQVAASTQAQIAGVSADFSAKLAASDQATQDRFNQLSAAQKAQAEQLATSTGDVQSAIAQAAATTTQQIAGLTADMQAKYDAMTKAQQAEVAARQQQGIDLTSAINAESLAVQDKLAALGANVQSQYNNLTAAQKEEVDARALQGTTLAQAIADASQATKTQIEGLAADTQEKYNTLTAAQKAEVDARIQQGVDVTKAINDTAAATQTQITSLSADTQAKYDTLTAAQKATVDALGKQGQDLTSEINRVYSSTQTQITGLAADTQAKYDALTAAQKAEVDARVQQGVDVIKAINDTAATTQAQITGLTADTQAKYDALTAAQKAEVQARVDQGADLTRTINEAAVSTQTQIAGLGADLQAKYGSLTVAQKAEVDARVQQGADLTQAINAAATATQTQIAGLTADMQSKYDAMTATQKADVAALQAQGQTLQDAIASTAAATQTQIAGLSADMQAKYAAMTAAQQTEVANRQAQGQSLQDSIAATSAATQTQITGLSADLQAKYAAMTAAQQTEVAARQAQGQSLQDSIAATAAATQTQIAGLSADLQSKYDAMSVAQKAEVDARVNQGITLQEAINNTASNIQTQITTTQTQFNTRVDQLVTQGQTYQEATNLALKELSAGTLAIQAEQQAAKEQAAATAAAQQKATAQTGTNAALAAGMGLLGGAVGAVGMPGGSRQAPAAPIVDDTIPAYKKIGFTSTGDTAKYVSPLEQYLKEVMGNSYAAPPQSQQSPVPPESQPSSPWSYGTEASVDSMLASSTLPEMGEYQTSLYSSKKGGLVPPLMAAGGTTRYGKYAGGGLNTVNFQGKNRIDFRTGNAVTGPGDGQSDDIPAMLADGEFVFPADVVSALGNGSTKAGSDKLYDMMHSIRSHSRSTAPKELPPPSKSPLEYLNKRARR